jgi:predicted hotdog family 3-hydroxylacyl-ACP dehydratase
MVTVRDCPYPIEVLVKHRAPMLLLDQVIGYDDDRLVASVTITHSTLFLTSEGVPGHIAIEYMAQACGAYAGVMDLDAGRKVKLGFLLGTRSCNVLVPWFRVGDRLIISTGVVLRDDQLAALDCKIEIDGEVVADAVLKVYRPDDNFLRSDGVE